ncbi:MAG: 50S ribosome-binding GTPase, partial [Rhodobacteraceae bacterium]|nr:50S ribosome-binding GTPase [Paracoccaceae bacterium]
TTLHPNLGVVGVDAREFVMADIPGLIEGASEGRGLGDQFLGHVERCAVLLQLVDGTSEDVAEDWRIIDTELHAYSPDVALKPRIVAMNKIDALDDEERAEKKAALEAISHRKVMLLSAVSGEGVQDVLRALMARIDKGREVPEEEGAWEP